MTEHLYGAAAPVFTVDGEVRGELARDVLRLEVNETIQGLKSMALRLVAQGPRADQPADEGLLYLDGDIIDFGKELEVSIGFTDENAVIFRGAVSGIEADFLEAREPEVMVFGEDPLMKLRMTRHLRRFENVSDSDIAETIASDHGLGVDASAEGPTYDVVHQWNMSDLAFLRERAALVQAEVWMEGDTLHFASRGNRPGPEITLVQGNHLIEARIRADLAHQRSSVSVSGYDASAREVIDEETGVDAILAEVSGGRIGPSVLEQVMGERRSFVVREAPITVGEARDWARAQMLHRCRQFVTVVGTTHGTPEMTVGSRLTLERVGEAFEGDGYYVTRVCQTYDLTNGHRTEFEAERATINST